jgi:hypothetical protein
MLTMIREDEEKVQMVAAMCAGILTFASGVLTILDPADGDKELMQAVVATLTKLYMLM